MQPALRLSTDASGPDPSARAVFEILVREHADMLVAYLRSLISDAAMIDDLFQETMLVAWRRLSDFDHSRPFAPWLRGIAGNLVQAHRRTAAGRHVMSCEPAVLEELDACFSALAQRSGDTFRDRAEKLKRCMDRLPEKLREVVDLAYARGMLLRQIAEALGSGEEAVKKRIQRARESLVECFLSSEAI